MSCCITHPAEELLEVARALTLVAHEQRLSPRTAVALPVTAVRLDEEDTPVGEPFYLATTDISANGIGMMYTEHLSHQRLMLTIHKGDGRHLRLVAEVVRCDGVNGLFKVGARLLARLS